MAYPFERRKIITNILKNLPRSEIVGALDLIKNAGDDAMLIAAVRGVASQKNPIISREEALTQAETGVYTKDDNAAGEQFRNSLLADWAESDPEPAKTWAVTQANPDTRDSAVLAVSESLLKANPPAAIEWAQENTSSPLWPSTLESLVGAWAEHDLPGVATWLRSQTPSHEFDGALRISALKFRDADTATALSLASNVTDPDLRQKLIVEIQPTGTTQEDEGSKAP